MSGVLTGLALAAAIAQAAAREPQPATMSLEQVFVAEPEERPDVRTLKQRRRAARAEALGWLDAAADDQELATRGETRRIDFADFAEPSSGPEGLVWSRPSLLTLGRVPGQPDSEEWLRWQAAVEAARRWSEERAAEKQP